MIYDLTFMFVNILMIIACITASIFILLLLIKFFLINILPVLGTFYNTFIDAANEIDKTQ